jgi:hypothetical protein
VLRYKHRGWASEEGEGIPLFDREKTTKNAEFRPFAAKGDLANG